MIRTNNEMIIRYKVNNLGYQKAKKLCQVNCTCVLFYPLLFLTCISERLIEAYSSVSHKSNMDMNSYNLYSGQVVGVKFYHII